MGGGVGAGVGAGVGGGVGGGVVVVEEVVEDEVLLVVSALSEPSSPQPIRSVTRKATATSVTVLDLKVIPYRVPGGSAAG